MYFPDDNSEKYPGILYPGDMTVYHNQAHFIYIFKMESFSAVKFSMSYEKNVGFLVIPKLPKFGKKVKTMGLGAFKFRLGHWKQILFFPSRFLFW